MHKLFENAKCDYIKYLKIVNYKKGDCVFSEGDVCTSVGLVLSGGVNISTFTILENEYSINIISENGIFASTLLFSKKPVYLGNGICTKETKIAFINKDNLLSLFQEDKAILTNYLSFLATKRLAVQERLKILCQKSVREKILFFIKSRMDADLIVHLSSKEKLASYLNIPRPSISRELGNLKKEGLIEYDRYMIKLKKDN